MKKLLKKFLTIVILIGIVSAIANYLIATNIWMIGMPATLLLPVVVAGLIFITFTILTIKAGCFTLKLLIKLALGTALYFFISTSLTSLMLLFEF